MPKIYIFGFLILTATILLAWSPWVTNSFAINKINEAIAPCKIGSDDGAVSIGSVTFKKPFGRELVAIPTTCPEGVAPVGTGKFFVSAFGTVHKIDSNKQPQSPPPATAPAKRY